METGFGAVLERFEKAFGKHVTNLVLALIGTATAVFCGSIIWNLAVSPVVAWFSAFSFGPNGVPAFLSYLLLGSSFASGFMIVIWMGFSIEGSSKRAAKLSEDRRKLHEAERALERRIKDFEQRMARAEGSSPTGDQ